MRFCHLINASFVCKAKEGGHIRIIFNNKHLSYIISEGQATLFSFAKYCSLYLALSSTSS